MGCAVAFLLAASTLLIFQQNKVLDESLWSGGLGKTTFKVVRGFYIVQYMQIIRLCPKSAPVSQTMLHVKFDMPYHSLLQYL